MGNPFRPGNGIIPPYLAGREGERRWFESSLVSALSFPQNLVLSGIRGTGKTVLLRKFEEACTKKKWLFVKREFSNKLNQEGEFLNAAEWVAAMCSHVPNKGEQMVRYGACPPLAELL